MVYLLYIVGNGYVLCTDNPPLVRNVGHVLVLSVKHTYSTYEINVEGLIRFLIGNVILVANWIYMVNYVLDIHG